MFKLTFKRDDFVTVDTSVVVGENVVMLAQAHKLEGDALYAHPVNIILEHNNVRKTLVIWKDFKVVAKHPSVRDAGGYFGTYGRLWIELNESRRKVHEYADITIYVGVDYELRVMIEPEYLHRLPSDVKFHITLETHEDDNDVDDSYVS